MRWQQRDWLLLCVLLAAPLFFRGGPDWLASPAFRAAWSLGHIPFFALFVLWLDGRWRLDRPARWLLTTFGVLVLSAAIELIQSRVGREASWQDGLRNLIGFWLGMAWCLPAGVAARLARLATALLVIWQLNPLAQALLDRWHYGQRFPVLSDFEQTRDLHRWQGQSLARSSERASQGEYSLTFRVGDPDGKARYTGIEMAPLPADWRDYRWVAFSLYSDQPLALTLRLNDTQHDRHDPSYDNRYNGRLNLEPGWNHFRIDLRKVRTAPAGREMNLAEMQRLKLFATSLSQRRTLYLDDLRLER